MATTTNYGWTTPDDTALVKDGAAAIRTLGSSVDTTTKNLNPSTTLGDIEYRSSTANTNTRLGIGSTGQVLTVAGGVPSWATSASGGMTLLDTLTLSGSSTTSTTFSSAYKQLIIYAKLAHVTSGSNNFELRLNGDSGSNYAFSSNRAEGVNNQVIRSTSATAIGFGVIGSSATPLNSNFAIINIMQPDQNDVVYIQATNIATDASSQYSQRTSGIYDSSAVITSVTLLAGGTTFNGGTVYIYGVN